MKKRTWKIDQAESKLNLSGLKQRMRGVCRVDDLNVQETDAVDRGKHYRVDMHASFAQTAYRVFKVGAKPWLPGSEIPLEQPLQSSDYSDEKNDYEGQSFHAISITLGGVGLVFGDFNDGLRAESQVLFVGI